MANIYGSFRMTWYELKAVVHDTLNLASGVFVC